MAMAEYFLGNLSRGTRAGLMRAKARGTFTGGSKGSWMRKSTHDKAKKVLNLFDKGLAIYEIKRIVEMDDRTINKIIENRDNLPPIRSRTWDQ
jgi:DNA invertase Pin-like site-specific DNA recombinase